MAVCTCRMRGGTGSERVTNAGNIPREGGGKEVCARASPALAAQFVGGAAQRFAARRYGGERESRRTVGYQCRWW